jgi:hypothetical protein
MMLSDDKITHLTHVVLKGLLEKDVIDVTEDEGMVRRAIKRVITTYIKTGEHMDEAARRKIQSLSRNVPEGSPEWETLYQKYLREEELKRGLAE